MSSTLNGTREGALDPYYTPDDVAAACVRALGPLPPLTTVWEPHAGHGAFVRAFASAGAHVSWSDLDPNAPCYTTNPPGSRLSPRDARDRVSAPGAPDWVGGNPPFNEAESHVRAALARADVGAAFLLRLAFLESEARKPFWKLFPPAEVHVLQQRVRFLEQYEDGTIGPLRKRDKAGNLVLDARGRPKLAGVDSAAYGWFIWRHGVTDSRLRFLDLKESVR